MYRANTIEEYKTKERPKVVLTWAPHPRALPQAVPNSFAEWMNAADYDFVITHPHGYELDPKFVGNAKVEYDQNKALEGADFVYAKNWAAYTGDNYGKIHISLRLINPIKLSFLLSAITLKPSLFFQEWIAY